MTDNILDQGDIKSYLELMPENQRDPEALAKKAYHADTHIKMLETRQDELRRDYLKEREDNQTRAKLEDLIKTLETKQLASSEQPIANEVRETTPTFDLKQIDDLLSNRLQRHEVEKREQENANLVRSKLKERFGDNYSSAVKQQINELGLSEDDFNALARKSPSALFKTLGVEETRKDSFQSPIRTSTQFTPKTEIQHTWSYYQGLKKENPRLYHDPKITIQMEKDAIALGDAFYDGDFNAV